MDLYFYTDKESETGLKFFGLWVRGEAAKEASITMARKYGFESCRPSRTSYNGGISSFYKPSDQTDLTHFKKYKNYSNEYFPKRNTKEGFAIIEEINQLPVVDIDELNNIVGYDTGGWKNSHIGFNIGEKHYGFIVGATWDCKIPSDCIEVTGSEYLDLFKKD